MTISRAYTQRKIAPPPMPNLNITVECRPTEEQNAKLRASPSEEEVWKSLKNMPNGKVPGMDGITSEIVKYHWGTMKNAIVAAVLHFFRTRRMLKSLNHAILTLIPKKNMSERLEDYHLISCLGVPYKILSKLLVAHLMNILSGMIKPNQTTFIRSRRITDAIGLAQEFTQAFNCKSTSRRACITIDFSKAFDTLRWDAIESAMELLGIDKAFREMVMACITTASISALVEGSLTNIIKPRRGLRQGDPLRRCYL